MAKRGNSKSVPPAKIAMAKAQPKATRTSVDTGQLSPKFSWKRADDQGPHGTWSELPFSDLHDIIVKFEDLEGSTRNDLLKQGSHAYTDPNKVSTEIYKALTVLGEIENFENLWSFRVGKNKTRVWALWIPPITHILWHDPNHKGCLSKDFK